MFKWVVLYLTDSDISVTSGQALSFDLEVLFFLMVLKLKVF